MTPISVFEAYDRAIKIWGSRVQSVTPWGDDFWIEVHGEAMTHRLDQHGAVCCQHEACRLAERRVDRRGE